MIFPPSYTTPRGICIHELATTIQKALSEAPNNIKQFEMKCTFFETLFHPKRKMPREAVSKVKAIVVSKPKILPKKLPAESAKVAQLVPN